MHTADHPTRVAESPSLAMARSPTLTYELQSDDAVAHLSALQCDSLRRLCQAIADHGHFLLGDGTGVGKGRVLAAAVSEWRIRHGSNARILWCSANSLLFADASRDLNDVSTGGATHLRCGTTRANDLTTTDACYVSYGAFTNDDGACVHEVAEWLKQSEPAARLIMLDEAHLLRRRSVAAERLQTLLALSGAGVVYSTATLASSTGHLGFVAPLVGRAGTSHRMARQSRGKLEALAIELKLTGTAVSRQLDRTGISVRMVDHSFSSDEIAMYRTLLDLLDEITVGGSTRQRLLRTLVARFKVRTAVSEAEAALRCGKSVVVAVQHTGEAAVRRAASQGRVASSSIIETLRRLGVDEEAMPPGLISLDETVDALELALRAYGVAEVTGRHGRAHVRREIEAFQRDEKRVCLVSRAGTTGISLHGAYHGTPRVHIMLELAWSSEEHIQMCGRTFRAGTTGAAVEYCFVSSAALVDTQIELTLESRVMDLVCLTHADRHASTAVGRRWAGSSTAECRRTLATRLILARAATAAPHWAVATELSLPRDVAIQRLGVRTDVQCYGIDARALVCSVLTSHHADSNHAPNHAPSAQLVATCVAALGPVARYWLGVLPKRSSWLLSTAHLPQAMGARVQCVRTEAACARSWLNRLPECVVEGHLIPLLLHTEDSATVDACASLADELEEVLCGAPLVQIVFQPLSKTLIRAASMDLESQALLLRLLETHACTPARRSPVVSLHEALSTPSMCVCGIELRTQTSARSVVHVTFKPTDVTPAVWVRRDDGAVCTTLCTTRGAPTAGVDVVGDDEAVLLRVAHASKGVWLSSQEWAQRVEAGEFVFCDDAVEVRAQTIRLAQRAARSVRRATGEYEIRHRGMMTYWDSSAKVLVTTWPANASEPIVGLLIGRI